jgi:hypothetical protein
VGRWAKLAAIASLVIVLLGFAFEKYSKNL